MSAKRVFYNGADGHVHWVSSEDPQIEIFQFAERDLVFRRKGTGWNITVPREQVLRVDEKV